MVDVGGAVGHVARAFTRCGVRATLFDRPAVIPLAREYLGEDGRDIALVEGDFTEALPPGSFDLVYFGNVYHIYSPATMARVTREAYAIVSPGGTIAIQDYVWGRSPRAAIFAVNMLQATEGGGVWSEAQLRTWLREAGFAATELFDLETAGTHLVLARRPLEDQG
jgi:SAM-dependent methyltransferase